MCATCLQIGAIYSVHQSISQISSWCGYIGPKHVSLRVDWLVSIRIIFSKYQVGYLKQENPIENHDSTGFTMHNNDAKLLKSEGNILWRAGVSNLPGVSRSGDTLLLRLGVASCGLVVAVRS